MLRTIKSALQNFTRHGLLTFTTITIMTLTLISITLVALTNIVINDSLEIIEEKLNISIELFDGLSENQIEEFKSELEKQAIVKEIIYTSKDEALIDFKDRFQNKNNLIQFIDNLDYNPLYATFTITTESSENFDELRNFLERPAFTYLIREIKDEVNQTERIRTFRNIKNSITRIGIAISIIFGIIAILIIYNTIRIGIHHRKQEIRIMKLVGASYFSISFPFIIEGILYSIFSLIFTYSLMSLLFWQLQRTNITIVQFITESLSTFYRNNSLEIITLQIVLALILGSISAYAAIYSYLHKKVLS